MKTRSKIKLTAPDRNDPHWMDTLHGQLMNLMYAMNAFRLWAAPADLAPPTEHRLYVMNVDYSRAELGNSFILDEIRVSTGILQNTDLDIFDARRLARRYRFFRDGRAFFTYAHENHEPRHDCADVHAGLADLMSHLADLMGQIRAQTESKSDELLAAYRKLNLHAG